MLEVSAARPRGVGDATTGRSLRIDSLGAAAEIAEPVAVEPAALAIEPAAEAADEDSMAAPLSEAAARWAATETWPVVRTASARQKRRHLKAGQPAGTKAAAAKTANSKSAPSDGAVAKPDDPKKPVRRWSAWSLSFVVHAVMAVALSLMTIAQMAPRAEMDLVMAPAQAEDLQFAERELDPDAATDEQFDELLTETSAQSLDPGTPTLGMEEGAGLAGELTAEIALVGGGGGGAESGPYGGLGGAGGLFGDGTGGLTTFGSGLGGAATAKFFGTKIEGRRIVFVLDNSGSMQQGRLETVIAELVRCVESLDEKKQEFYVIFYSDMAYPLFFPNPADNYVRPTERNKARLAAWLDTVELCLGDAVIDALSAAISIEPDTVFLLSDGRIQGDEKMTFLLQAGGGEFPIHTVGVGLGAGATASRQNLQEIADTNHGDFREAQVPDEMRKLARDKPRPYHNKTPGPIWGRSVKAWGGR